MIALERALDEKTQCLKILQQITAIRGAVNGLMSKVLQEHIREHLAAHDVSQTQREDGVEAVVRVLWSYMK